MDDTARTEQQDDSARRNLAARRTSGHVRVVHPRNAVVDMLPSGITIGRDCDLQLDDTRVSRRHVRLAQRPTGWTLEDLGSRNGGYVDGLAFQPGGHVPLDDGSLIRIGDSLLVFRMSPRPEDDDGVDAAAFPGVSPAAHAVRRKLATLRAGEGHVLVFGETGTGKERVAHAIAGNRKPIVSQNCAELRPELARSELFGHVQGAFSGASQAKPGRIESAGAGALFLDEIGEMDLGVQADLLRFLEDGSYRPVGGQKLMYSEARIVAATNVDLERASETGKFRRDLFGRLTASNPQLKLPALRDRREDLFAWTQRFAREVRQPAPALWTAGALECLLLYNWPQNLRGLRGLVRDLAANAEPPPWQSEQLPEPIQLHRGALRESCKAAAVAPCPVADRPEAAAVGLSRAAIEAALRDTDGEVAAAAKRLRLERTKLYRLCKQLGIAYEEYRVGLSPKEE